MTLFNDFPTAKQSKFSSVCKGCFRSLLYKVLKDIEEAQKEGEQQSYTYLVNSIWLLDITSEEWLERMNCVVRFLKSRGYECKLNQEKEFINVDWYQGNSYF